MVNSKAKSASQLNRYPWLIAVSGGMDSMALLHWAKYVKQKSNLRVIHIDHGIRVNSELDGEFVKEICQTASIPYIGKKSRKKPLWQMSSIGQEIGVTN
jgi:tRNA(Ile)-lysidine synthase TilS/MesJ